VSARAAQRRLNDVVLQLKGLVLVRALLESRGVPRAEIAVYDEEIERIRGELAARAPA
jgi:hypothetical protein